MITTYYTFQSSEKMISHFSTFKPVWLKEDSIEWLVKGFANLKFSSEEFDKTLDSLIYGGLRNKKIIIIPIDNASEYKENLKNDLLACATKHVETY